MVIHSNDHAPAHVHMPGPGLLVVNLIGRQVGEVLHADERTANEVLRQLASHQDALLAKRERFHG